MRGPVVCSSPTGKLWLVLDEGRGGFGPGRGAEVVDLETGEKRTMTRSLGRLLDWGWRVVEGEEHLEWRPL